MTRSADGMGPTEYLRTLAETVRILDREPAVEYDELPMAGWEFLQVFPHLFGFDAVLMDATCGESTRDPRPEPRRHVPDRAPGLTAAPDVPTSRRVRRAVGTGAGPLRPRRPLHRG
ncbi:hypothetical protein OTB20_20350 [Streptomyces sp. H27-H1]|uniref:hypothetical protein n=1 Tax=Streptomyces sp. H27-H1 TaxID=2996461 RepID=UPI0022711C66|nr:hypothetical protein [Streptomyces sp. H27-H1]MCY0928510.1 hypothetical protein [Streptomyces sp. H27-H1]